MSREGMRGGLALAAVMAALLAACAAPKLTEIEDVPAELDLTEAQVRAARPHLQRIASAVEDYESDKAAIVKTMSNRRAGGRPEAGGRADRQEDMRRIQAKRVAYQEVIDRAVDAISAVLDEAQRQRWDDIEKPVLTPLDRTRGGRRGDRGGLDVPGGLGGLGGDRGAGRGPGGGR